jgi:hypothetical protein
MTAKEKAKQIERKMCEVITYGSEAKECADIAVREILNAIYNEDFEGHLCDEIDAASYWKQVIKEIEQL